MVFSFFSPTVDIIIYLNKVSSESSSERKWCGQRKSFKIFNVFLCVLKEDIKKHRPTVREESRGFVTGAFSLIGLWKTDAHLFKARAQDFADLGPLWGSLHGQFCFFHCCYSLCSLVLERDRQGKTWQVENRGSNEKKRGDQVWVPYQGVSRGGKFITNSLIQLLAGM